MAFDNTVVVAQGKGGVGKTSLAANLAGLAAAEGQLRVLLVDLDQQANLRRDLGTDKNTGDALLSAARDVGIRITLLDTCYLAGGLTAGGHVPLDEVQQRFSDGSVEAWAERVGALPDGDTARIGAAVHSVRAVPVDDLGSIRGRRVAGLHDFGDQFGGVEGLDQEGVSAGALGVT